MKNKLKYCGHCKENSIVVKVYVRKSDGKKQRVEYCINKGHLYKRLLPFPEEIMSMWIERR